MGERTDEIERLTALARSVVEQAGLRWPDVVAQAREIVVFGSHSAGVARDDSDVDIVCVGNGRRLKRVALDLVWISEEELETTWLASELASHVAVHGVWLRGNGRWRTEARSGDEAMSRKAQQVMSESVALRDAWNTLSPHHRERHAASVRRNLQRLHLLAQQVPIPPTAFLDREWDREKADAIWTAVAPLLRRRAAVAAVLDHVLRYPPI